MDARQQRKSWRTAEKRRKRRRKKSGPRRRAREKDEGRETKKVREEIEASRIGRTSAISRFFVFSQRRSLCLSGEKSCPKRRPQGSDLPADGQQPWLCRFAADWNSGLHSKLLFLDDGFPRGRTILLSESAKAGNKGEKSVKRSKGFVVSRQ
ncbi:hypothetical protein TGRUB_361980 [Toxoplasma gondii RUB]|uniref:Uncharacterized protein n=1 Tax=Toxoplasma gondii RUB TaxID=935652 RepID=A0A086M8R8_TOXGO|nr:hypothetical protein TGRUB_361980 [Toxoplasma gondii RUB]